MDDITDETVHENGARTRMLLKPKSPPLEIYVEDTRSGSNCKLWNLWLNATNSFHHFFERSFYRLGYSIATHPFKIILSSVLFVAAFAWGFLLINNETRTEKLYIPQESRSLSDIAEVEKYFTVRLRLAEVIITSNKNKQSILTEEAFKLGLDLHQQIISQSNFNDVCVRTRQQIILNSSNCILFSPFELFHYNSSEMNNILLTLNQVYTNPKYIMSNHELASSNFPSFFGQMKFSGTGQITKANSLRFFYYVRFPLNDGDTDKVLNWEERFIRTIQNAEQNIKNKGYNIYYFSTQSIDESVKNSTMSDTKLIYLAFALMCTFTVMSFVKPWRQLLSHGLLAQCGLIAVIFGIGSSFGFLMIIGIPFVSIVGVLPFVILGVAIDDMFIIIDCLDRIDINLPIKERIATTLSKCGGTITMTTLSDLVAFTVSMSTEFPAVRYFCAYAAMGLLLSYLLIITFFVACMTLDLKRSNANRMDVFCCIKHPMKSNSNHKKTTIASKIMKVVAKAIMTLPGKIIVILIGIILLISGLISSLHISEHFDLRMLGQDGSYYLDFIDVKENHFDDPHIVSIMIPGSVDLSNVWNQQEMNEIETICLSNKHYKPRSENWFHDYITWADKNHQNISNKKQFFIKLMMFLQTEQGSDHLKNIIFNQNRTEIIASRIVAFMKDYLTSSESKTAMTTLREDLDTKISFKTYPATMYFMYYEQYVRILPETTRNLILCAVTILIMTSPYVIHPGILFLLFLSFSVLIVELLGLMAIWNVSMNSISMIVIIMAIGFSVDYSAHVAHAYVTSIADTPEKRMIDALSTVGASVFMGGFSTFLGMITTAFASSEVFRIFFKMLFGIVVIGLLNGLIILPVLLTVFCKTRVFTPHEMKVESQVDDTRANITLQEEPNETTT